MLSKYHGGYSWKSITFLFLQWRYSGEIISFSFGKTFVSLTMLLQQERDTRWTTVGLGMCRLSNKRAVCSIERESIWNKLIGRCPRRKRIRPIFVKTENVRYHVRNLFFFFFLFFARRISKVGQVWDPPNPLFHLVDS